MSRGRFGLLLALLVLVTGVASFVAVYLVLDDAPGTPSGSGSGDTGGTTIAPSPRAPK